MSVQRAERLRLTDVVEVQFSASASSASASGGKITNALVRYIHRG